jgi:APA family basic amino acid/polyamine antiporter
VTPIVSSTQRGKPTTGHLLRVLGTAFGIAVGVGNTIGTGILRTPGTVADQLGSASLVLIVWSLGGVYALLGCSSISELATMLPDAGGFYAYSRRAFGERTGFVVGCMNAVMFAIAISYLSVAMGEFAAELFPAFAGHEKTVGITGLVLLTLLNWIGLRAGSRAQEMSSLAKALGLIALVVACFVIHPTVARPLMISAQPGPGLLMGLILGLQGVIVSYDGWYAPIYFAEEDRHPTRNLPRAMFGTVLACASIYVLVNAALLHALGIFHLAGARMPATDAALLVFGRYGKQIILLISLIAVTSTVNALLLVTPRVLFAMARDRLLPAGFARVNQGGTPTIALLACSVISLVLVLSGSFESLISIAAILFVANYVPVFASVLVLRKSEPNLARPYKVWFYPWTTLCLLGISLVFLTGSIIGDLTHSLFTLILILLSWIAAVFVTRRRANVAVRAFLLGGDP